MCQHAAVNIICCNTDASQGVSLGAQTPQCRHHTGAATPTCSWSGALQKNSGVSSTLPSRLTAACAPQQQHAANAADAATSGLAAIRDKHTSTFMLAYPGGPRPAPTATTRTCLYSPHLALRASPCLWPLLPHPPCLVPPCCLTRWMKTCPMRCATSSAVTLTVPCRASACGMCFVSSTSSSTRSSWMHSFVL